MKRTYIVLGILVACAAIGGGLYLAFPNPVSDAGGLAIQSVITMDSPAGTLQTETNPDFKPAAAASTTPATTRATGGTDWPSYNRTLTGDRFSPMTEITPGNAGQMKVLCTYDTGQEVSFETGLLMVNGSLIGTTQFDIFALDPATCAEKWRTHEDYPGGLLPVNRGAAYMDGMLFRGTQDGRVLAYDFQTGKRLWETTIANPKIGETVPAAPIAWEGMVYVGQAGGDNKGVKGRMYGLDGKTGKIVWEFYLVPKGKDDVARGPLGRTPLDDSTWQDTPGIPISGGANWTSTTLDPATGSLYVPAGNPAPDFATDERNGINSYSGAVVVLDSKTGDYRNHYDIAGHDWHDWDASNPPILIKTRGGKSLMAVTPKDGHVYGFDLATDKLLYRVPATTIKNATAPFVVGKAVSFCPGPVGGAEWNSPAYNPNTNLITVGEVDWCFSVTAVDPQKLKDSDIGSPWMGTASLNPLHVFGVPQEGDKTWHGWVYAVDADTGQWAWRAKLNYPVASGMTPTDGGVVFFGDMGGNFYALDAATGNKLFTQKLDGAIGGGVITYDAAGSQKVAVAAGFTSPVWPVKVRSAKVVVLGLDGAGAKP